MCVQDRYLLKNRRDAPNETGENREGNATIARELFQRRALIALLVDQVCAKANEQHTGDALCGWKFLERHNRD